jgi:hypothetical protein
VHRPLGEQRQDGGANITSTAASAATAAASTARTRPCARTEPGAEAAGTESASESSAETGSETRPEGTVVTCVLAPDVVAELTAGLFALFVQGAAVLRCESEARRPRYTPERPAYMRLACFKNWVVH